MVLIFKTFVPENLNKLKKNFTCLQINLKLHQATVVVIWGNMNPFSVVCILRSGPESESHWKGCEDSGRNLVCEHGDKVLR